jgi:hypothetical protein
MMRQATVPTQTEGRRLRATSQKRIRVTTDDVPFEDEHAK